MTLARPVSPSRRAVFVGGGALILCFSLSPHRLSAQVQNAGAQPVAEPPLPGGLKTDPVLDSWIRIDADGKITVFTGKAELGQGLKTALVQLAAEELVVEPEAVHLVTADTAQTPNEGYTAGSHSMQDSGTAIMNAAAQVRMILINEAATRLQIPADRLKAEGGAVIAGDGRRLGYGELVSSEILPVRAEPRSDLLDPERYRLVGKPVPRVDIPAKVTGGAAYVQDMRLPDMVHGRIVWPPSYNAKLRDIDTRAAEKLPGVLKIVRDGNYLAVVAEREYQAVLAMRALQAAAQWDEQPSLPDHTAIFAYLERQPFQQVPVRNDQRAALPNTARVVEAQYRRPYQLHGSIGPSCAVGLFANGALTIWTHSQGVYPLRNALAQLVNLQQDKVRRIHVEGSGCYGHNGADDVGADAALLAVALPGRPVRVQWMREQEHSWEPYGCPPC